MHNLHSLCLNTTVFLRIRGNNNTYKRWALLCVSSVLRALSHHSHLQRRAHVIFPSLECELREARDHHSSPSPQRLSTGTNVWRCASQCPQIFHTVHPWLNTFSFLSFNWSTVGLWCCVNLCCIATWFSYAYVYRYCAQALSRVRLPATLWTRARQAPLSTGVL